MYTKESAIEHKLELMAITMEQIQKRLDHLERTQLLLIESSVTRSIPEANEPVERVEWRPPPEDCPAQPPIAQKTQRKPSIVEKTVKRSII
jgi:hypothetical protein